VHNPTILATSWAATLCEPLVSTERRVQIDLLLGDVADEAPRWMATFLGGMVADHIATLPDSDPWRHLVAQADGTVLTTQGLPFGDERCGGDLVMSAPGDPAASLQTAALAGGLEQPSALLLATAGQGWEPAVGRLLEHGTGRSMLDVGGAALRWAMWRRRAYVGVDDPLAMLSAVSWVFRAGVVEVGDCGGVALPQGEQRLIESTIREYAIDPTSYERYRID